MRIRVLLFCIAITQVLYAMNVDRHNFYTRDYLDFGQNLGQFTPGATNITITKKDGSKVTLPNLPFPDFSKFDGSNRASLGGAYTASAYHVTTQTKALKLGDTEYNEIKIKKYLEDSSLTRTNKFIVEGGYKATNANTIKDNKEDYLTQYNGGEHLIVYRSGNGRMSFDNWTASANYMKDTVSSPGVAGGFFYIEANNTTKEHFSTIYRQNLQNHYQDIYGPLKGVISSGDSGSPAFIFNHRTKAWEIIGTGCLILLDKNDNKLASGVRWCIVNLEEIDSFKKEFEIQKVASGNYDFTTNKDNVYNEGGTISIEEEVNQGAGGIILKAPHQTLTITGNGSFTGAGVDVAKDAEAVWDTGVKGDLHKIGKGVLEVTKATGGNLRMGEGITKLSASNSFKQVHLANNEGTLIINAENATNYDGLSFGRSGATLDLNGYNAQMAGVKAYNANAIITNNAKTISTLTLNNSDNTMIHANIQGNINIQANATNANDGESKKIIFDGGFNLKTLSGSNQHIVLQGKPVPHATWKPNAGCDSFLTQFGSCTIGYFIEQFDKHTANRQGQSHMVENKNVSFTQPDWLQKAYKGNLVLDKNSKLFIEKNADVHADIALDNSTLTFNSKMLYIDNNDSKNLTQSIQSQALNTDTIDSMSYKGRLVATNHSNIVSNGIKDFSASVDLNHSTLIAQNDAIKLLEGGLKLANNSTITAKSLHIKDTASMIAVDESSSVNVGEVEIENSIVSLNTKNENLGTIGVKTATINVANHAVIPKNIKLANSILAFDNLSSTFSLNNSTFDEHSSLKANTLNHKQGDNISWQDSNHLRNLIIKNTLNLTNVGSGQDDTRFLALELDKTKMAFEDGARINVSFANTYEELSADASILRGNLYDMIAVKALESNGDVLIHFVGQNSSNKIQAVATQTEDGIKISFTDVNQVNSNRIVDTIMNSISETQSIAFKNLDDNQLVFLNDLIVSNPNHPLVLDVAFNKNNASAIHQIIQSVKKIDDDAKEISKIITQSTNLQPVNHHNNVVSNRINTIKTSHNRSLEKYASLTSDMPLEYPMDKNANLVNNAWVNAGGGYFDGGGNLKYFSTNIGYDRQHTLNESDVIVGALVSFGRSYASNSAYNDDTTNYGLGLYGVLTHDVNEVQLNANYVASQSKKYTDVLTANKVKNSSFGVNGIYKYTFKIRNNHAIKPIVGLEYVASAMAGYSLGLMQIKDYDYGALSGILGAEYAYTSQNLFLSAGISGKKVMDRANNKLQVGINGSNHFIGYDLQNEKTIYSIDVMADYKINYALTLGTYINLQTTLRGESGVEGMLRAEYRF